MIVIKKHSDNHFYFNGLLYPRVLIAKEFNGKVTLKDFHNNVNFIVDFEITSIEAEGKVLSDFDTKKEFLNFISEIVFTISVGSSETTSETTSETNNLLQQILEESKKPNSSKIEVLITADNENQTTVNFGYLASNVDVWEDTTPLIQDTHYTHNTGEDFITLINGLTTKLDSKFIVRVY